MKGNRAASACCLLIEISDDFLLDIPNLGVACSHAQVVPFSLLSPATSTKLTTIRQRTYDKNETEPDWLTLMKPTLRLSLMLTSFFTAVVIASKSCLRTKAAPDSVTSLALAIEWKFTRTGNMLEGGLKIYNCEKNMRVMLTALW